MATGEQQDQGSQQQEGTGAAVRTRYTGKQPEKPTTIPTPQKVQHTTDSWIREGRHWKRVHVKPGTEFYVPTPQDNGPDITKLLPRRHTNIKEEHNMKRIEDNWTTEPQPTRKEPWTGSTNFEESAEYDEELLQEDEHPQMATKAKPHSMPKQPTAQEIQEHNITHLPYRSWCPVCIQSKGRQANHPKQTVRQPIVQVDFTYIKGHGDKTTTPILSAIDIQTGMVLDWLSPCLHIVESLKLRSPHFTCFHWFRKN